MENIGENYIHMCDERIVPSGAYDYNSLPPLIQKYALNFAEINAAYVRSHNVYYSPLFDFINLKKESEKIKLL